jgi:hypothetical protein
MNYSGKRRLFEQDTLKRFQLYGQRERMPWMAKPEQLRQFTMLEARRVLKVPRNWVPMFNLVTDGVPSKVLNQTISKQFKRYKMMYKSRYEIKYKF